MKKQKQKNNNNNSTRNNNEDSNKKEEEQEGTNMNQDREVTCFCCGEKGHYSDSCPKKDEIDKKDWKIKKGTHMYCSKPGFYNPQECTFLVDFIRLFMSVG